MSHHLFDIVAVVIIGCSALAAILPPYEIFAFAPRFQAFYRVLLVFITQIGALNLRSVMLKLYPQVQAAKDAKAATP